MNIPPIDAPKTPVMLEKRAVQPTAEQPSAIDTADQVLVEQPPLPQKTTPQPTPAPPKAAAQPPRLAGVTIGPNGTLFIEQPPPDISDRAQAAQRAALATSLAATLTATAAGSPLLLDTVLNAFAPGEFQRLNCGLYHDAAHPLNVAAVAGQVTRSMGCSAADQGLVMDAAVLHDADERTPGTPARVHSTLEWMDTNQVDLQNRFGWSKADFATAQALIARTDFPFDDKPRAIGTRYDGKSPVAVYEEKLRQVPAERREQVMAMGAMLRFADQIGNYTGSFEQAQLTTQNLARELKMDVQALLPGTPKFLQSAGTDLDYDKQIAQRLGLGTAHLPTREALVAALPKRLQERYLGNIAEFEKA